MSAAGERNESSDPGCPAGMDGPLVVQAEIDGLDCSLRGLAELVSARFGKVFTEVK